MMGWDWGLVGLSAVDLLILAGGASTLSPWFNALGVAVPLVVLAYRLYERHGA